MGKQKKRTCPKTRGKPNTKIKKKKSVPKKKLYRKVSTKAHPDKGGNVEEFNTVKTYYEETDYIGLINYATNNDIEVDITKEDSTLLLDSFLTLFLKSL